MNADSPVSIQSLEKYHATMRKEEVAEALGVGRHIIAPLSRAGLIKPLGHPQKYCVKHYSRDLLARNLADMDWLDRVVAAIHRHWRIKNARKRAKLAKLNGNQNVSQAKGTPASGSVTR
jgi:hypothetical protein